MHGLQPCSRVLCYQLRAASPLFTCTRGANQCYFGGLQALHPPVPSQRAENSPTLQCPGHRHTRTLHVEGEIHPHLVHYVATCCNRIIQSGISLCYQSQHMGLAGACHHMYTQCIFTPYESYSNTACSKYLLVIYIHVLLCLCACCM